MREIRCLHPFVTRRRVKLETIFSIDTWYLWQLRSAITLQNDTKLGINTCPMEGLNPAKYDEVLGREAQGYATVVVCPTGYRATDDKYAAMPKVRYPSQDVVQYVQ